MFAALDFHTCPVPSPLASPFTHLLLSHMKYFSTHEEKFCISVAVNFYFSIIFGYGDVCL